MLVLSVPPPPNIKRVWIHICSFLIHQSVKKIPPKNYKRWSQAKPENKIPKIKKITEKTEDLSHMLIWSPMPDLASQWCNHLNQSNKKSKTKAVQQSMLKFCREFGDYILDNLLSVLEFKIPIPVMDIVNLWLLKFFCA